MRETISGPQAIPINRLGSVARALTFADATPAVRHPPKQEPVHAALALDSNHPLSVFQDPLDPGLIPPSNIGSAIRVVLRVRPLSDRDNKLHSASCVTRSDKNDCTVHIRPANPAKHPVAVRNAGHATFKFAHIFDDSSSQSTVFENTTLPMIEGLFNGQSAVVFAHGVTCSGKTWTIQGSDDHPGILPRSLDVIVNSIAVAKGDGLLQESTVSDSVANLTSGKLDFGTRRTRTRTTRNPAKEKIHDSNYIDVDGDIEYKIFASYLEVYNEQCYDLFEKSSNSETADSRAQGASEQGHNNEAKAGNEQGAGHTTDLSTVRKDKRRVRRKILKLKMNRDREVHPEGITEIEISNCADIDRLLEFGQQNRSVAHTKANEVSSRSHAVFFITLKMKETLKGPSGQPTTRHSTAKLSIVDLAGSERTGRTDNSGEGVRQTETNKINSSLMNLGRCLQVMRRNQRAQKAGPSRKLDIVPFRHSRLTHLLQHCLEAGSAVMIANVSPVITDSDETIQALRCAAIAQEVTLAPNRKKAVLSDRTNLMRGGFTQQRSSKKVRNSTRKVAARNLRSRDFSNEGHAVSLKIAKAKADEYNSVITGMKKEIALLKMELEDEQCNTIEHVRCRAQLEEENDKLFRENERLIDRLADSEARLCVVEAEVREEMAEGTEQLLKQVHDAYQKQLSQFLREKEELGDTSGEASSEDYRRVSKVHQEGKEQAEVMAARLARRASKAAFDRVRFPLAGCEEELEDDQVENPGNWTAEGEDYVDVDDYIEESD